MTAGPLSLFTPVTCSLGGRKLAMACGYDTRTVLEMLFDINMDNGINSIVYIYGDSNHSCSDNYAYELLNYTFTFQFIPKVP